MSAIENIFGDVISRYTRQQAIEDGFLVDLMQNDLGPVSRQHYKYPVACTVDVFELMKKAVENPRWCNDYPGILHDILTMSKHGRMLDRSTVLFEVIIIGTGGKRTHTLKLTVGPGDSMEPVVTITL
ncbi:MAG TPA: DUF6573 family protein [Gammaproteobacteria bacterium]|jgi:hypothetical protein|nr:DUF6573 family protein [Gammaproteobacteria bacterium]